MFADAKWIGCFLMFSDFCFSLCVFHPDRSPYRFSLRSSSFQSLRRLTVSYCNICLKLLTLFHVLMSPLLFSPLPFLALVCAPLRQPPFASLTLHPLTCTLQSSLPPPPLSSSIYLSDYPFSPSYDRSCSQHLPPLSRGVAPPLSLALPRSLASEDSRQTLHSTSSSFTDRER